MLQVAVSVCASLVLVGLLTQTMATATTTAIKPEPPARMFDLAPDGVNMQLPSASAVPKSTFGTPLAGASGMPSAASYTHTMFDE